MTKLFPYFAKLLFGVFVLGIVAAVMFYSFKGLGLIFPNDLMGQLFGMALFDIATIVWFFTFISGCASTMQYVFSGIGFLLGLGGTLGLVSIEVGLSSGMLAAGTMQKPLTYIFIAALVGHLVLIYAHHASEPNISAGISLGVEKAKITDQAEKEAAQILTQNLPHLSAPIAARLVQEVMKDLNIQPRQGEIIDLPALTVAPAPAEAVPGSKLSRLDFFKSLFIKKDEQPRTYQQAVPGVMEKEIAQSEADFWKQANKENALKFEKVQQREKKIEHQGELTYHPVGYQPSEEEKPIGEDASFQPGKETPKI